MHAVRFSVAVLLGTIAFHGQAVAVCRLPPPKLCQVLFHNDIAVRGIVKAVTPYSDPDDPEGIAGWRYDVDVLDTYKGTPATRIAIKSDNTTSRLVLAAGKEYVIFAVSTSEAGVFDAWSNCGPVQNVDGQRPSRHLVQSIRRTLAASVSTVEGEVRDRHWGLVKAVPVTISSERGMRKTVRTNAAGTFRMTVQPGRYMIQFPDDYRESSYSFYGLPEKPVSLAAGQCAQIQLQAR